ncbi:hypothetical protein TNCV_2367091 [Trichonephila clavipes]|nr:hypothetical protein TNCV_2367091 [Trichonephila clavipes]
MSPIDPCSNVDILCTVLSAEEIQTQTGPLTNRPFSYTLPETVMLKIWVSVAAGRRNGSCTSVILRPSVWIWSPVA